MLDHVQGTQLPRWSVSLRAYVTGVMLLALLPLFAHAIFSTWYSYTATRQWAERDLIADAEHLARDIDAQLDVSRAVMRLIVDSPAARLGDLAAVGVLIEMARSQGIVTAGFVCDPQDTVVLAVGSQEIEVRSGSTELSDQFLALRLEGKRVFEATWSMTSSNPQMSRLVFMIDVAHLPTAEGEETRWPWHVTAVADREGRVVWPDMGGVGSILPRAARDPTSKSGVVHDWVAPHGDIHANAFARASRSGLTVVIGQPMPGPYERLPLGPIGTASLATIVALLSLILARLGGIQIHAAYQSALSGAHTGRFRISEATRLAADIRQGRDQLLQVVGGTAVVEMWRAPDRPWREATVDATANLHTLLELSPDEPTTMERLLDALSESDQKALADLLLDTGEHSRVFTRRVRAKRSTGAARHLNIVGLLYDPVRGMYDRLTLTIQDITGQVETEQQLLAQASRLQLATELAGLGVWERDLQNNVGRASARLWEILGREAFERLSIPDFLLMVHPDDRERVSQAMEATDLSEIVQEGKPSGPARQLRYRIVHPDGNVRHIRSSRVLIGDDTDTPVHAVGVVIDETDALLAQRALAASEARFRLAVDVAELGVFQRTIGPNGNIGVWNERMWRIRGLEPRDEPMPAAELLAMVHPEDRERIAAAMLERRDKADGTTAYEFRIIQPNGEERIIQSRSVRTHDPEEDTISVLAINLDVTDRRRSERAIAESEARFRLAVETAELGVADLDLTTGNGAWNERLFTICGLKPQPDRPSVDDVLALVHPEDRARVVDALSRQRADLNGPTAEYGFRIVRPDGELRVLHVRSASILRADGGAGLLTVTHDVTEQHMAQQRLTESELRLRLAIEAAGLGVWDVDLRTRTAVWSDRMWELRGMQPRPGARGATLEEQLSVVVPEDHHILTGIWNQLDAPLDQYDYEYRVRLPDGNVRYIHGLGHKLIDEHGTPTRLIGMCADITERRVAERDMAERTATLELAMEIADLSVWSRDLGSDFGTMSHRSWSMLGLRPQGNWHTRDEFVSTVHPDDRKRVEDDWINATYKSDVFPLDIEYRVLWQDGSVRNLMARRKVVTNEEGVPLRVVGVTADVTEARRAAQALLESETRMRLAVEAANIGVFEYDAKTGAGYWTERTWQMRGLEPREGIPTPEEVMALVHPQDRGNAEQNILTRLINPDGVGNEHEFRVVWADGTVRHILSRSLTRRSSNDATVKVVGVNIDITDRVLAASLVARSEARFRLAIDTADLGVWDYDPKTDGTIWSPRMWEIRGLPTDDTLVSIEQVIATTHPDDRVRVEADTRAQHAGLRPGTMEKEYRVIRPDGSERVVLSRSVAIHSADGQLEQVIGVNADITDRRNQETTLRENEALFRLAIETANMGIYQMNMPARDGVWSDRMYTMRGLSPRPGMPTIDEMMEMVHHDDRELLLSHRMAHRTRQSGDVSQYEFRVVWPDGTIRHLLARAFPVRDDEGVLRKIIGVNQDITEQKRTEQELRDSAVRFELATKAAQLAVWEWQVPGGERHWSPEMWVLRGLPPRAAPPTEPEVLETIHPDDREDALEFLNAVRANPGERAEGEYRIIRPDGVTRYINVRTMGLRDATGQVLRVTGVAVDVTERRLATRALQESESLFRLAADAASQGVWDRDMRTGLIRWSNRLYEIYNLPVREVPPLRAEWMAMLHPDDSGTVLAAFRRLRNLPSNSIESVDFRIVWHDGTIRHLDTRTMSVYDDVGDMVRLVGVVVDITEEQELRAQAAIAGNVATLGQLAGGIAHELAQPLQAMIAAADTTAIRLAQAGNPETIDYARDRLSWISGLAARAGRTIQHLLAFSRGTSSSGITALSQAVAGALELVGRSLARAGVKVTVNIPDDLPMVSGGLVEIEQVLVNLLLNARDVLENRPDRRVEIAAYADADEIVLTLGDTGGGVRPDVISRIFDPFFTTKPIGKGTGLGLAIAQKTMVALGGSIRVRNTGQGAEFTLLFQSIDELL